mmetsp:Transcript_56230/g.131389  ORF Transcript_56230/g.131389 Transcript_56230/m.131389 type:complete len:111 (+) Transcript_56230:2188-2520(+)
MALQPPDGCQLGSFPRPGPWSLHRDQRKSPKWRLSPPFRCTTDSRIKCTPRSKCNMRSQRSKCTHISRSKCSRGRLLSDRQLSRAPWTDLRPPRRWPAPPKPSLPEVILR